MQAQENFLNKSTFEVLMEYAMQELEEEKQYTCTYCQQSYTTPQTRANHWSKSESCNIFHTIQRVEDLIQSLKCMGCAKTFPTAFNCKRHMKKCSLIDQMLLHKKKRLYEEKFIDRWNYGKMRSMKQLQDPKQSVLRVPEFIYEVKDGYICQAWKNFFKQQFRLGLPIRLKSDVRNDNMWENLKMTMFKLIGSQFKIVVQDNPWKGQQALPYEYLSIKSLRQIPLNQIQTEGIIFYWTLFNTQQEGFKILKDQGYEVIKALQWIKQTNKGNLINSKNPEYSKEYCLIGIKWLMYKNLVQIIPDKIVAARRQHSEKPQEFWDMIDQLFGEEYRLEIFTRSHSDKMHTVHIGNQIEGEEELRINKFV